MLTQVTLRMPPSVGPHRLSPGPNPVPMPLQRTCQSTARTHCCEAFSRLPLEARHLQHTLSLHTRRPAHQRDLRDLGRKQTALRDVQAHSRKTHALKPLGHT